MKGVLLPDPVIMTRGGVENPSPTLLADPGPWFGFGDVVLSSHLTHLEHRPAFGVMIGVHIGFIPGLQCRHIPDSHMVGTDGQGRENGRTVVRKAATHQLIKPRFVGKAPAGTVNGQEAMPALHKLKQVSPLSRGDFSMVGVEQKRIKAIEVISIAQCLLNRSDVIKVDRFAPQGLGQHRVVGVGRVMGGIVAKKKYPDGAVWSSLSRRVCEDTL